MKKLVILITLMATVLGTYAQGVHFEEGLGWQQVLKKAKAENKYVFVDCYASWCVPCKDMDALVYNVDSLGVFMNAHFISVKVQMDRTSHDNDTIKSWYDQAAALMKNYSIQSYPSFMFFDADGKAVHKGIGFLDAGQFEQIAKEALEPTRQFYSLYTGYRTGQLSFNLLPQLANAARAINDKELAKQVAADYMHNYLDKLSEKDFLTKGNAKFMEDYHDILTSKDRVFQLCFNEPVRVDTTLHDKGYAVWLVNTVIYQQEITPKLKAVWDSGPEPRWAMISLNIKEKFGKRYVESNLLQAKISWYKHRRDGKDYTHYLTIRTEKDMRQKGIHGFADAFGYNNTAFEIFQYDTNPSDLEKAISWMDGCLKFIGKPDASWLDTKANLLYKSGKKQEAIKLESQANKLDPKDDVIAKCLTQMQASQPTWPDKMP